jgi:hypothetical protein
MSDNREQIEEDALELVRYMIGSIIDDDVDFELESEWKPGEFRIGVHVPPDYRGRIIGRHGRVARSMRNILSASKVGVHRPINLDIVD